ncbi:MAG: phospholipase [Acidobacteria bacterium]|nr:phospholipase [Acidobacteriota bacterium]|tara:strand:- start:1493 stop:2230 length:738 start_codon:yes stop_codon:yes gene_type:complete
MSPKQRGLLSASRALLPYNSYVAHIHDPVSHTLSAKTLGRYLTLSPDIDEPAPLLVGFHGYGENADHHLEHLRKIPGVERWHLASVQALHRFYERRSGKVVGSWMTSQDRHQAIQDNLAYVHEIVTNLRASTHPDTPLVYAGFSQGVAMAYRAALGSGHPCAGLLILAGDIPPELQDEPVTHFPPVLLGYGRNDPWYTTNKQEADLRFLRSQEIAFETIVFDGAHQWHDSFYKAAGRFLERIRQP